MRLRHLNFWTAPLAAVCPKIVALALLICGKISCISGIVALSVAAQRDLRGKSPRALSSLCGLRAHITFWHMLSYSWHNSISAKKYHFLPSDKSGVFIFSI